ncbi:MAG: PAS domain S-box protein [Magnetococcales bacterium]|nr:PAS domain S-box protein [Magnetococcales bacterium]
MMGLAPMGRAAWKMVVIFAAIGLVALGLLDYLQSHLLGELLKEQILSNRDLHAQRDRIQLDQLIKGFHQSIQVMAHHKGFVDYVEKQADNEWVKGQPVHATIHRHPPAWFPANSVVRTFLSARHVILLDGENRVRELYQHLRQTPSALLPPSPLLLQLSRGDTFMTYLDEGIPYILTTETIRRRSGRLLATLVFATPMDDQLLATLQSKRPKDGSILVLFDSQENPVVLTSSDVATVSAGESLEQLRKRYHVTNLDIFDYGSSELLIQFASLTGKKETHQLVTHVSSRLHILSLLASGVLLLILLLVVIWFARSHEKKAFNLSSKMGQLLDEDEQKEHHRLEDRVERVLEKWQAKQEELRTSKNQLATEQALLQSMMFQVDDAVIIIDQQGMVRHFNRAAEHIFGLSQSEMTGHSLRRIMGDALWERHCQALAHYTPDNFSHVVGGSIEVTAMRADGSSFPLELKVAHLPLQDGGCFVGVMHDLTQQKQLALTASLREAERLYRDVLEQANMAVMILDRQGHILFCNDYLLSLTRFSRQELLGSLWWQHLLAADEQAMLGKFFQHTASLPDEGFTHHAFESRILLKDGESRLFNWNVLLLRDENHLVSSQAMLGQDLTWQRKVEQEMDKLREESVRAYRDKNYYLARLNHEIRSPLNAIVGFVDILSNCGEELPDEMNQFLGYIQKSSRDLVELLNNVLDYARMEEGRMGVVMEEINPRLLIQGAYHLHKPEALHKALAYTYQLEPGLPEAILSDRTLLNRILLGLLLVAIHGANQGGKVVLRARQESSWFILEVEDDGPSLPYGMGELLYHTPEEWHHDGLQRLSTCPMALPLVKKAVDKLQGRISLRTLSHQGVLFEVRLPLLTQTMEEEETLVPFQSGQRVLVVLTDSLDGQLMRSTLRQMGIEPLVARSMTEAALIPGAAQMQLLITEAGKSPDAAGLQQIPTLLMVDEEIKNLPAGVVGCLLKPLERHKLHGMLAKVLRLAHPDSEAKAAKSTVLPAQKAEQIGILLDDLAATPLYRAETIVRLSRQIKGMIADFQGELPDLCDAIIESIHSRNSHQVPTLVNEARFLLETQHGDNSHH